MGWSGDITLIQPGQTKTQDFQWVLPKEGGMLWTDNMAIPKGTPNIRLAETLDRLLLRPEERGGHRGLRQLRLPGLGAREVMLDHRRGAGQQPADLPAAGWLRRLHQFRATTAEEEVAWSEAFTKAAGL